MCECSQYKSYLTGVRKSDSNCDKDIGESEESGDERKCSNPVVKEFDCFSVYR